MTNSLRQMQHFTCFKTKLFMKIIGDSPAYAPPITATWGPGIPWTVVSTEPFLPASSVSVRSTVLRYSELASGTGAECKSLIRTQLLLEEH